MRQSHQGPYTGQCLCGSIQYEVDVIETKMAHCHCSMCRKFHGAAFATYGEAKVANFRWTAGEEFLKAYLAANGTRRKFCERCGSSMIFMPSNDTGELVEFSLGTLDSTIELQPDAHVFTDNAAPWHTITDQLPQFSQGRDSEKIASAKPK